MKTLSKRDVKSRVRISEASVSIYSAAMMIAMGVLKHPVTEVIALATLLILALLGWRDFRRYSRAYASWPDQTSGPSEPVSPTGRTRGAEPKERHRATKRNKRE